MTMMDRLLRGEDLRRDTGGFLEDVNAYSTGDIAETTEPTVVGTEPPVVMGTVEGLRLQQTDRGWEGIDEASVTRTLYGTYDDRVGTFLFDPGGTLQVAIEEGGVTLYNVDGTASVVLRDGQIYAYDATGAQVFGVAAGLAGGVGTVDVFHAVQRVYRTLGTQQTRTANIVGESFGRIVELAEGSIWFGPGTSIATGSDGAAIDYASPNRLRVRNGGIGNTANPFYYKPPKFAQTAATPLNTALTTTYATQYTDTLTLAQTCDVRISGVLRVSLTTLAAARNEALYVRFTLGGVQVGATLIHTGDSGAVVTVSGTVVAQNIAAGTHTIVMEARKTNAADTVTSVAGDFSADAMLS